MRHRGGWHRAVATRGRAASGLLVFGAALASACSAQPASRDASPTSEVARCPDARSAGDAERKYREARQLLDRCASELCRKSRAGGDRAGALGLLLEAARAGHLEAQARYGRETFDVLMTSGDERKELEAEYVRALTHLRLAIRRGHAGTAAWLPALTRVELGPAGRLRTPLEAPLSSLPPEWVQQAVAEADREVRCYRDAPATPARTRTAPQPTEEEARTIAHQRLPLCAPGAWKEADVYNWPPDATCRAPDACTHEYWLGLHGLREGASTPVPPAIFASGRCLARSERGFAAWVTVTPDEGAPFTVFVYRSPVTVVPNAGSEHHAVDVQGVLAFRGRAHLPTFGVRPELVLADGRIETGSATRVRITEVRSGSVVGVVEIGPSVTARPITVACSDLRATREPTYFPNSSHAQPIRPAREAPFPLFTSPKSTSPIEVSARYLSVFEETASRTRIELDYEDGTLLRGWVPNDTFDEGWGGGEAYGASSGGCGCKGALAAELRVLVRSGTPVFGPRGTGRWATFARPVELPALRDGPDRFRLLRVPHVSEREAVWDGGCDDFNGAFVRAAEVRVTKTLGRSTDYGHADGLPRFIDDAGAK